MGELVISDFHPVYQVALAFSVDNPRFDRRPANGALVEDPTDLLSV